MLEATFFEEVKQALQSLGGDSSPGPGGFPTAILVFQKFWFVVHDDVMKFSDDFY